MANILVLEDKHALRRMLSYALIEDGHTVTQSDSGQITQQPDAMADIDVMITDLFMPGGDGIEAILRAKKAKPTLKIIAMSGGGTFLKVDYLPVSLDLGANDFIRKPFEPDAMLVCLRNVLAA